MSATHRWRRSRPLYRPPRHKARGQGRVDRLGDAVDAEDGRQSRRVADRSVRPNPRRRARRSLAILQGSQRALLRRQQTKLARLARAADSFWLQGMMAGFKAVIDCIKAFSETISMTTSKSSMYRRSSCTVTPTRSCRLRIAMLSSRPSKVPR